MISGNIGSATLKRLDYTVIGDVVNTAQRLQAAALPSQIIISEHAFEKIKGSFNCVESRRSDTKEQRKPPGYLRRGGLHEKISEQ